jgi:hypothetical protein
MALSVVLWWNVWSTHPAGVTTCACGDASLFLWFLEWPAYAIAHGHNPFYSTALFHPGGINLLSNTSVLAVGVLLAPITWLFGPVATLNVASTLAPALSGLAMFWLLRRWVRWDPAAFAGGLVFGFSPFVFVNLAGGHLMTSVLVPVPLIVGCLDELLVTRRRRPVAVGALLGLLVTIEFFLSTEVLAIIVICALIGVAGLAAYAALVHLGDMKQRAGYLLRGLGGTGAVAVPLLAYPVWFAFWGPAHLTGLIWPTLAPGTGGISLSNIWQVGFQSALRKLMQIVGGYEGPALPQAEYLGVGILIVAGLGLVAWRRERRLWFFTGLAVLGVGLSLGINTRYWVPWNALSHLPVIRSIIPSRFFIATTLSSAVVLAIVVDRVHGFVSGRIEVASEDGGAKPAPTRPALFGPALASLVAIAVAAVATVPIATALSSNTPFTTTAVQIPQWFRQAAPHLSADQVLLAYPAPFTLVQSAMAWQAIDLLHYSMAGGGGPGGVPTRAGKERAGFELLSALSFSVEAPPEPEARNVEAIRQALAGWGVTTIVVPDPAPLPRYDQGTAPAAAIGFFTLATGTKPQFTDDAWVWNFVGSAKALLSIPAQQFATCSAQGQLSASNPQAIPSCILDAARTG